jgi:hypothetical protein
MILPSRLTYDYNVDYLRELENQYFKIYETKLNNEYLEQSISKPVNNNESCDVTRDTICFKDTFVSDIYSLIQNEKNSETIKIKLAYDPSFTLIGLFKHFDKWTSDYISYGDMIAGLKHFNIFDDDRIRLIFNYFKVNKLK